MNAHLETNFKKGFRLTEEALIKIDDLIRRRITTVNPMAAIQFKVFRVDGMLLEFDNPTAVAAEENSKRNAIKRIEIAATGPQYKLRLRFDPKDNTDLEIDSDDRDLAYLLFSDVKEYLNAEVLKFRSFTFDSILTSKNAFPFIFLPFMLFSLYSIKEGPTVESAASVLNSTDLNAKLNFLIQSRATQDMSSQKNLMFGMFGVLALTLFFGSFLDRIFPRNIFYWGKLAQTHDKISQTREKVVWGIVIAFVIGIASTVAVDYFKTPDRILQPSSTPQIRR